MRPKNQKSVPKLKAKLKAVVLNKMAALKLERTKLDTPEQIQKEAKRLYRRYANKQINSAEYKTRINGLAALRQIMIGTPDPNAYAPPEIRLIPVPSGYFLSEAQAIAAREGRSLVDLDQFPSLQLADYQTNNQLQISEQTNSDQTSDAPQPVEVEPSRRELRNQHFRPEFRAETPQPKGETHQEMLQRCALETAGVRESAPKPVDPHREEMLARAREDEANGKSSIMRPPHTVVRWPKPFESN